MTLLQHNCISWPSALLELRSAAWAVHVPSCNLLKMRGQMCRSPIVMKSPFHCLKVFTCYIVEDGNLSTLPHGRVYSGVCMVVKVIYQEYSVFLITSFIIYHACLNKTSMLQALVSLKFSNYDTKYKPCSILHLHRFSSYRPVLHPAITVWLNVLV